MFNWILEIIMDKKGNFVTSLHLAFNNVFIPNSIRLNFSLLQRWFG